MNEITLRPYQQECIEIINNIDPGAYLVVMATGLGKTVTFSQIERRGRVLILSHREELVHQPQKYFDCSFGIEQAEESSNGEEVISASVPSLVRRLEKFSPDDFDILITDEAQHAVAPSYQKIYDYFNPRLHLGFTATPNRADKNYLGSVYSKIIFNRNIKWGIDNNYLCDIECQKIDIGYDLHQVHSRMGDFVQEELAEAVNKAACNEAIGEVYRKYAVGPTLIFTASVDHANSIASYIPGAEVITGTTLNRGEILERFRIGEVQCIVNCMVLTEGTDLPNIETIIMCRPTQNISLYTQCVGRGTRLYPGKDKLHLIDCVGASSMNICTAPVLFGIDPLIAARTKQDNGLLSDMEKRIEEVQNKLMFNHDFWKLNAEMVDLFQKNGDYDTHGINFTMLGNGDMVCSLGNRRTLKITAEDMLGKTSLQIYDGKKPILNNADIEVQDALDSAFDILEGQYADSRALWNNKMVQTWGSNNATKSQRKFIIDLYNPTELKEMKVDLGSLSKYQASILINRRLAEK